MLKTDGAPGRLNIGFPANAEIRRVAEIENMLVYDEPIYRWR